MTIQAEITAQTRKAVKQVQDITLTALENLPKPVAVVETAFGYSEMFLANAKHIALQAAQALTPDTATAQAPTTAKKTPVKKTVAGK